MAALHSQEGGLALAWILLFARYALTTASRTGHFPQLRIQKIAIVAVCTAAKCGVANGLALCTDFFAR